MSLLFSPHPFTRESKQEAIASLQASTVYDRDYYVLLFGAVLLAIGAIFTNSIPVLIASMIVAPLAQPVLALGLGVAARDLRLVGRSLAVLGFSCVIALLVAVGITLLFGSERVADTSISFTGNRDIATVIAFVSGMIAAYGLVRPRVASAITGIAIAVSLMPPLVDTGVSWITHRPDLAVDAFILFLLNVAGILAASALVFSWFGLAKEYRAQR
jgi:uncharacterized hydrophobic protein (TIGR00271 family)